MTFPRLYLWTLCVRTIAVSLDAARRASRQRAIRVRGTTLRVAEGVDGVREVAESDSGRSAYK